MKFSTLAVHAGYSPEQDAFRAVMPPIYQSSIFAHTQLPSDNVFSYTRVSNPTRQALEHALAALENARFAYSFGSGMAAIDAVFRSVLSAGDEVIAISDLYGGAYRLLTKIYAPQGVHVHFANLQTPEHLKTLISPKVKLIWLETPSNPLLNVLDLPALCDIARAAKIPVAVDNTFATPYLQNPLSLGADLVMHSATKYLGGHSDVLLGAVMTNDDAWAEKLKLIQASTGAVPSPHDCFLTLRGLKTLALRMAKHCENALEIAQFLESRPEVERVFYPALPSHPHHALAQKQMRAGGGVVSIYLRDNSQQAAERLATRLKLFALGESLGGVESIINHSYSMSHGSMPKEIKAEQGIRIGLLRLSVGIEDVEDLKDDLRQAFETP